jgi:hypothetical protein
MDINSKETLHKVLDEMIEIHSGIPSEIALCNSYRVHDDNLYWRGEYRDMRVQFYPEWFAKGKIAIN